MLASPLFTMRSHAALIWKDDFSDDMIFELTWDTKNTTGTTRLSLDRLILEIPPEKGAESVEISTLPARSLPGNFDLQCAVQMANPTEGGLFILRIGDHYELGITISATVKTSDSGTSKKMIARVTDRISGKPVIQMNREPAEISQVLNTGDVLHITWISDGEKPSHMFIKVGSSPGEGDIADFIIETDQAVSGAVTLGIRNGMREVQIRQISVYVLGTSTTLVHDWILF